MTDTEAPRDGEGEASDEMPDEAGRPDAAAENEEPEPIAGWRVLTRAASVAAPRPNHDEGDDMKRRRWITALATAIAVMTWIGVATAGVGSSRSETVRIVDAPVFAPSAACARFEATVALRTPTGDDAGRAVLCVQQDAFECDELGCRYVEVGTLTLYVRSLGRVVADVRLVDNFNAEFSHATHVVHAAIVSAPGCQSPAAACSLTGGGTIAFDTDGTPHPSITYEISLTTAG